MQIEYNKYCTRVFALLQIFRKVIRKVCGIPFGFSPVVCDAHFLSNRSAGHTAAFLVKVVLVLC